jgi:hypothetical protein
LFPGPLEPQSLQLVLSGLPLFEDVSLVPLLLPAFSLGGNFPLSPMVWVWSRALGLAANPGVDEMIDPATKAMAMVDARSIFFIVFPILFEVTPFVQLRLYFEITIGKWGKMKI